MGYHFFTVRSSIFEGSKPTSMVEALFAVAGIAKPGAIICIDECDKLLNNSSKKVANACQEALCGVTEPVGNVFMLAATNRPWLIPDAMIREGRMGFKMYIPYPSYNERLRILQNVNRDFKVEDDKLLAWVAAQTEGYSGSSIASSDGICGEAQRGPYRDASAQGIYTPQDYRPLTKEDFTRALEQTSKPDTNTLKANKKWAKQYAINTGD